MNEVNETKSEQKPIVICEDEPTVNGLYVVYVDSEFVRNWADKKLMVYVDGTWGEPMSDINYRGRVHGWIGPLPALKLDGK